MYNRLISFVNKHNILSKAQNGFREMKSRGTASQASIKTTQEVMDQVVGIFVELTQAYDVLNHNILLDKLNSYGVRGNMNLWFKCFLFNCLQFVGKTPRGTQKYYTVQTDILSQENSAWFATRPHTFLDEVPFIKFGNLQI